MNTINTSLTTSGNSVAVRLPKDLLRISGLGKEVTLEAKNGKIIISKAVNARETWSQQIQDLVIKHGDPTLDFIDLDTPVSDSFEDLAWDGPSFEEWKQNNDKLS
jgi:antitoxin component of MazEF toxin-antitoxin module